MVSTKDVLKKYSAKIESEIDSVPSKSSSQEYKTFRAEMVPTLTRYEKWAQTLGNIIKLTPSKKDEEAMRKDLEQAHIEVTPSQAITLSIFALLLSFFLILLISMGIYFITESFPILFLFLGLLASLFLFYYAYTAPKRFATQWRLKASSQMVPAILYMVVYMKHTSNLEKAVEFASQHLEGHLALDFKKVFYDIEIGKFSTLKLSLDNYLEKWQESAPEFVESFHLIESSLYESSESRRIEILEKSLQIILDGVYEKMMKYSRDIRSPLTNVYMLGIILPTLGLALLPLASVLLQDLIKWYHVVLIFNLIIPFFVWYMTSEVLLKRPGGYGDSSILELNPLYSTFASKKPWLTSLTIALPLLLIGLSPFLFQIDSLTQLFNLKSDYTFGELHIPFLENQKLFDFQIINDKKIGPFSPLGVILSLLIPLAIGLYFSRVYKLKTRSLIKAREDTKILEEEFTNSLFQLGNRLGDGVPAEIAFAKVAESTKGQKTQSFFALVNQNIQHLGMSVERAIFDKKHGAIIYYPSSLISTSMRILVESSKKGLQVAARSLMSISEYVKNIQKINQRLRDLLAEIISDMRSNMTFLAPLLAGIVIGLSTMITSILNKLTEVQETITGGESTTLGSLSSIINELFTLESTVPPYFIQISSGIYIIEIVFILTITLVTVDAGKDTLKEKNELSKNLRSSLLLYLIAALISITLLTGLSIVALSNLG